jgi:hypothetical protein
MRHDPFGDAFFGRLPEVFPHWQQLLLDDDDRVVGKVNAIPFRWDGTDDDLPDRGWDAVLERGFGARRRGIPATAVSLLEARLAPDLLGGGRSREMLEAMGARAVEAGMDDLFGPVRPTRKHEDPHAPMADYALATRADGLPADPWLRVHVRMGGSIVKVAPASMVIPGPWGSGESGPVCRSTRPARWSCRSPATRCMSTSRRTMPSTWNPTSGSITTCDAADPAAAISTLSAHPRRRRTKWAHG